MFISVIKSIVYILVNQVAVELERSRTWYWKSRIYNIYYRMGTLSVLRLPQGFLASNDACIPRYENFIKDMAHNVTVVDDTCLCDHNIREA